MSFDAQSDATPADHHQAARAEAYELIVDVQTIDRIDRIDHARDLEADAQRRGWSDVRALAAYVRIFRCAHSAPELQDTSSHIEEFLRWAMFDDDALAIALARVARAIQAHYLGTSSRQLDDLALAFAAAERIEVATDRALALHEIACYFHELHLWELATDLYDEVGRLITGLDVPRSLAGSLSANRRYALACELLHACEYGRADDIRARAERVHELAATPLHVSVPYEWRPSIDGMMAICLTLADSQIPAQARNLGAREKQEDVDSGIGRIEQLLTTDLQSAFNGLMVAGLLRGVLAWHHLEQGRDELAEPHVAASWDLIAASGEPNFRSFGLWLRARLATRQLSPEDRQAILDHQRATMRTAENAREALSRTIRVRLQTERLRVERDRFAKDSLTDPLTGLANRRDLEARLDDLAMPSTLIIFDIDRFKPINDRFGHDVGDTVLRAIGQVLQRCVRPGDLAARLGGDEFILLLDTADPRVATRRGNEVLECIRSHTWHDIDSGLRVTASMGVASGDSSGATLYRSADRALYSSKRASGARSDA